MEPRRALGLALGLALLAPSVAAWSQAHGEPGRNGAVSLPPGPLDVIAVGRLPGAASGGSVYTYAGAPVLETPAGLATMLYGDECRAFLFDLGAAEPGRIYSTDDCRFGSIQAYDAGRGILVACMNAVLGAPLVAGFRPGPGEPLWRYGQGQNGAAAGGVCLNAALDDEAGTIYAAIISTDVAIPSGVHAIDVETGARRFVASISALSALGPGLLPAVPDRAEMQPRGVTLTSTGFVATGFSACAGGGNPCSEMWAAWYDRDGTLVGFERAATGKGTATIPMSSARAGSQWAAANGALAAFVLGDEVLVVNPERAEPVLRAPVTGIEPPFAGIFYRSTTWTDAAIVVPLARSLRAFEPATLAPMWAWTEGIDAPIQDVYRTPGGSLLVLASHPEGAVLVRLHAATGAVEERASLPFTQDAAYLALTPLAPRGELPARLLVVADNGEFALVGVADPAMRPSVRVHDEFPPPGGEVVMEVSPGPAGAAPESVTVDWGDGRAEPLANGTARRVLTERGATDVLVRATFANGTTATRVVTIHVGGTPPHELTLVQKAFAPEVQEYTFFGLGLLVTVVGVAVTVGRQRHRLSRLERELAAVEEIRLLSVENPREAARNLKAYRERLPADLARRRIDESQFHVLDVRSARLLKVLRTRLFAPFDTRLSARYHRLLDAAFEDAILQPSEKEALLVHLDLEEAITREDKAKIAELLDDFTSYHVGLALRD